MTKPIIVICFTVFVAVIVSCSNSDTTATKSNTTNSGNSAARNTTSTPASTVPATDLATGRELYNKNCSNCHRESGEGGPTVVDGRKLKPDNLTDDRRKKLSDDKYIKTMVEGIEDEGMPSFKDKLSEAEMREVVRYIRVALQKQEGPNVSPAAAHSANAGASPSSK